MTDEHTFRGDVDLNEIEADCPICETPLDGVSIAVRQEMVESDGIRSLVTISETFSGCPMGHEWRGTLVIDADNMGVQWADAEQV